MMDSAGQEIRERDPVTLLRVTDAMISGLPDEEAIFLRSMLGQRVPVSEVDDMGIEVTMTDTESGIIHFLRVGASDVTRYD